MNLKSILFFILSLFVFSVFSQEEQPEGGRQINIVYGANFTKNEAEFPGASIFSKDDERQVQFEHQGADLWCDIAVFYSEENRDKYSLNTKVPTFGAILRFFILKKID